MENTAVSPDVRCGHGLCFYMETKNHRLLFDMGPDEGFLENARRLGVDIAGVDTAILSHGHYDHGGGLAAFLEVNTQAKVHVQKKAFGAFYSHDPERGRRYIGLPEGLKGHPRVMEHSGDYRLDEELFVFGGITGRECYSPANDRLYLSMGGRDIPDLFMHEQNLLITEGKTQVLVAGCAHNGIANILKKAQSLSPSGIDYIISGMHLMKAASREEDMRMLCHSIAERLKNSGARVYTCHCTGLEAYALLKEELGDTISYLSSGSQITLPETPREVTGFQAPWRRRNP